jgi:hypothetical protein
MILDHKLWPAVLPFVRVEYYDRDTNAQHEPRFRLEVNDPGRHLRSAFLALRTRCANCDRLVNPIKSRRGSSRLFITVSCDGSCQRGRRAHEAYEAIRDAVESGRPPTIPQPTLF